MGEGREEEASFSRTLEKGIERFKKAAASIPKGGSLPGKDAFELWDTFGFPVDLTEVAVLLTAAPALIIRLVF